MLNIQLGEIVFGGVGSGLYGMLLFVVLAVFIAGLMVGRTPEYLGKKIEAYEVKMASFGILLMAFSILGFSGWACLTDWGKAGLNNTGPHGLSEILYAYTSCTGNNGSAFAGLTASTCEQRSALRYHSGIGDVNRPIRDDDSGDGPRRFAGAEEAGRNQCRYVPGVGHLVCGSARWDRFTGRSAYVFPSAIARADPGTLPHVRRQTLFLIEQ